MARASALPATKVCIAPGPQTPPPGILKPLRSHGWVAMAWSLASHARASSSRVSAGTMASSMPASSAAAALILRPSTISGSAARAPIIRGRRWVPPPPGSRPTVTSGWPNSAFGLSAAMRRWQARAISSPPPSAVPGSAATKGLPQVSMVRLKVCKPRDMSNTVCASSAWISANRSAPAIKSRFAEVTITPVTASSATTWVTAAPNAAIEASLSTFIDRSAMFQVKVAMPSAAMSMSIMSSSETASGPATAEPPLSFLNRPPAGGG